MSERTKIDDSKTLVVQLTVAELKDLISTIVNQKPLSRMGEDRLVNADEAAKILSVSKDWVYHTAKRLPFTRKIGGTLRFSVNGMQRWLESKKFL